MRQKKSLSFTAVILILFLLSAGGAILWSFLIPDFSPVWVFALPFLLAGRVLAALSLSGTAGNIAAWLLYLLLAFLPAVLWSGYRVIRRRRQRPVPAAGADLLLVLLSLYGLFLWYCAVNPALLFPLLPENFSVYLLSIIYWSVLAAWLLLRMIRNGNQAGIPARLKLLVQLSAALYAMYAGFFRCPIFFSALRLWAGADHGPAAFLSVMESAAALCLDAVLIAVLAAAGRLLAALEKHFYCREAEVWAGRLSRLGRGLVYLAICSNISLNLMKLLLAPSLTEVNVHWNIPVIPVILALAACVLTDYLKSSRKTYEDQQLFI